MLTGDALLTIHQRGHQNLQDLLVHCATLESGEIDRTLEGFGYPSVRLQIHHAIGAEEYWVGVLNGVILVDEDDAAYPTVRDLQAYRERVHDATRAYLAGAGADDLNTARPFDTWGGRERLLTPAFVILRTVTHLYHHQGQVTAMCRLLGKPVSGLDFPLT